MSRILTGNLKLISDSAQEVAFTAIINAGPSGEPTEAITFRPVIGKGLATTVELVSATVKHVSGNSYILTVTRKKSGTNDVSGMQKITIFATDSFGAETMVDINGDDPVAPNVPADDLLDSSLVVEVNAPPRLAQALPDVTLYREDATGSGNVLLSLATKRITSRWNTTTLVPPMSTKMTLLVCSLPVPSSQRDLPLILARRLPRAADDPIKAITIASVVGGYETDTPTQLDEVTVDASPDVAATNPNGVTAAGLGSFTLTITCTDTEKSVSDTATITVRP